MEDFGCEMSRIAVRAHDLIEPHEQVSVIVLEHLVVDVVVRRRTETQLAKDRIPRENVLRMDQGQPAGVG